MVISIALLGYGASGSFLTLFPALKKHSSGYLFLLLLSFPIVILISVRTAFRIPFDPVILLWDPLSLLRLSLLYLILALPFVNAGLIISLGYTARAEKAPLLYLFDLLGGAAGAVAGPLIFAAADGRGIPVISIIASFGPLLAPWKSIIKRLSFVVVLTAVSLTAAFGTDEFVPGPNPYKDLSLAMLYEDARIIGTDYDPSYRVDVIRSPAALGAPGLSLNYSGRSGKTVGVSIDGGLLTAVHLDGPGMTEVHRYLPTYLPYHLGRRDKIFLEDSRGGLPLLAAADHGAQKIVAAEPYPLVRKMLMKSLPGFSDWAGNSGIKIKTGWARNVLARSEELYDLIEISLTPTTGAASTGLMPATEDYRLTRDALRIYLDHLSEKGMLSLTAYILPPPRTEGRLIATAIEAIEEKAGRDYTKHLFCCRSFNTISLFMKNSPFETEELNRAREFCRRLGFDIVYYKGIGPEEINKYNIFPEPLYEKLLSMLIEESSRNETYRRGIFNIEPVTDDKPFFFGFVRFRFLKASMRSLGGRLLPLLQSGLMVWFILIQAGIISAIVMLLPLVPSVKKNSRGAGAILAYFSLIGMAYMLMEIAWIQKFTMLTGRPSVAASIIIAVFLLFSGAGSLSLGRLSWKKSQLWIFPAAAGIAAAVCTLILYNLLYHKNVFLMEYPFVMILILAAPAAFLMGAPFPAALGKLHLNANRLVPWAWALNGCLSVVGAVAAPTLAFSIGYTGTAVFGAFLYIIAALFYIRLPGAE